MDIIIDLKNEKRSKVNVEMSWKISVAERKDNFWDKLPWIRNNQNIERHVYVTIQNISVPKEIVYDKDKLFSIVSKQQEFGMETFRWDLADTARYSFSIIFQPTSHKRL